MVCDSPTCPTARLGFVIRGGVPLYLGTVPPRDDEDERDRDPDDDVPETPLDEPEPPHVQDPPPQPDQKGPYVVSAW